MVPPVLPAMSFQRVAGGIQATASSARESAEPRPFPHEPSSWLGRSRPGLTPATEICVTWYGRR